MLFAGETNVSTSSSSLSDQSSPCSSPITRCTENSSPSSLQSVPQELHGNISTDPSDSDSDHSIPNSEQELPKSNKLANELKEFFDESCLSIARQEQLLIILNVNDCPVPQSVYQLHKIAKSDYTVNLTNDSYYYVSIKDNLAFLYAKGVLSCDLKELSISFGIDGLPLYKSSKKALWPILALIHPLQKPVCVALFLGEQKPEINQFLSPFVDELKVLQSGTLIHHEMRTLGKVTFVCDSVARSYIQCVKGHMAVDACPYCRIEGEYKDDRMTFAFTNNEMRSDQLYAAQEEDNQITLSPIAEICGLRSSFPPDYMHNICLGVCKKLLKVFVGGSNVRGKRLPCRFSTDERAKINKRITKLRSFIPSDFQRKMRTLDSLEYFKATEFRQFIIYLGPFVLKNILATEYYEHFLYLHYAVYTLSMENVQASLQSAQSCIERFCSELERLFASDCLTFNFHLLRHLAEFCETLGSLDAFSAFPFEAYLAQLKRRLKPTRHVLSHVAKETFKMREFQSFSSCKLILSNKSPDNCVLTKNGSVLLISSVYGETVLGRVLIFEKDLYKVPYPSSVNKIGFYSLSARYETSKVAKKCIAIPKKSQYLVIPYAK